VLEAERSRLRRWIPGVAEGERIEVLLFPVEEFLRSYSHGATVLGLFDGRIRVPFADLRSLHPTLVAILSHELAHALVAERVGSASVPTWFHEGLAQHVQMADQPTNELADLERSDRAIALPALEAILAGDGEPQFTEVAYAEAAWLVHYLEARFGVAALHRLLDAFAAGQSEEAALESITGETLGGLNAAVWEWGSRRAPAVWPTTLRRYDRELELAEVRGEPAAPARTLATTRPAGPDPAARRAAVESWHRGYTAKVRGMKSALGTVYRRLNGQDAGDLGAACRALEGELVPLLADRQLFSAPEAAINDSLRGAFVAFREAAAACSRGESAMSSAHIRAAERSLGTLASRLAAYGLDP
jgi:hypothetical protein